MATDEHYCKECGHSINQHRKRKDGSLRCAGNRGRCTCGKRID